jgi:Leucyl aminopeptidase (aminopeptidase T)
MKGLLRPEELARYADAVVKVGLSLGRGDDLLVTCQPAHREFAVALVEAGYRVGARNVDVEYSDPLVRAAYLRTASDKSIGYVAPWRATRVRAGIKPRPRRSGSPGRASPER